VNLASLRIEGEDELLASLVNDLGLAVDTQWKKGEPIRSGGTNSTSGFCATIGDASSPGKLLSQIREFVAKLEEFVDGKDRSGLAGEVAVGISVGDPEMYIGSFMLGASDLLRLGQVNLSLSVSAYPTSDEANING
jgi:hypothetical protein